MMDFFGEITPYRFEPEYTDEELEKLEAEASSSAPDSTKNSSETTTEWCKCGECDPTTEKPEAVCCWDWGELEEPLGEQQINCIVHHKGLHTLYNKDVLISLYINFLMWKKSGARAPDVLNNRQYRLMAYRHFIAWAHKGQRLGRGKRRVIPSCVVKKIRMEFPSETYTGFKDFEDAENMNF